ncbi:hypothetical protein M0R45_028632 [Rubus argutus]|uniref:Uncharacterized protein n=1 Tax=Rubus argutus TaxID=59490 RepID=A0AAW1W9C4_RUBAR
MDPVAIDRSSPPALFASVSSVEISIAASARVNLSFVRREMLSDQISDAVLYASLEQQSSVGLAPRPAWS